MLSEETVRRLADVDRDGIEDRIRTIYDLWARGDVDAMSGFMAEDIVFPVLGAWTRLKQPAVGKSAVRAALARTSRAFENITSVLHEIVIDGNRAVVHRTAVGRVRENGERYQADFIAFFRFRDGYVVEYSEYPNAAWAEAGHQF